MTNEVGALVAMAVEPPRELLLQFEPRRMTVMEILSMVTMTTTTTMTTITMTTTKTMATYPSLRHWPFPCLSLFLSLCSLPLQPCSASRRVSLLLHSFKSLLHTLLAFPLCPLRCYAFLLKFSPSVSHTTGSHCLRRNHGIARILCWFRFRRRSHPGRTLSTVHLVLE